MITRQITEQKNMSGSQFFFSQQKQITGTSTALEERLVRRWGASSLEIYAGWKAAGSCVPACTFHRRPPGWLPTSA